MSNPLHLQHVKSYQAGGKTYHYSRITKERLPDDLKKRTARVREINSARKVAPEHIEEQGIERLKDKKDALLRTIQDLEKTAHDLRKRIKSAQTQAQHLNLSADPVDVSAKPDAYLPWQPPLPAPKRLRGVYRLLKGGRTVYIGQSGNIIGRVIEHTTQKDFDEFSYALVDGSQETLNEIESALIIIERPPMNSLYTVPRWSQEEAQAVLAKYTRTSPHLLEKENRR